MKRLLRPVCWVVGHDYAATMLPEDPFGYSSYSKTWCRRCGWVLDEFPIEDQIEVLMGYVTLWNDVRPVVDAARRLTQIVVADAGLTDDLRAALAKYEALYPEHAAPPTPTPRRPVL